MDGDKLLRHGRREEGAERQILQAHCSLRAAKGFPTQGYLQGCLLFASAAASTDAWLQPAHPHTTGHWVGTIPSPSRRCLEGLHHHPTGSSQGRAASHSTSSHPHGKESSNTVQEGLRLANICRADCSPPGSGCWMQTICGEDFQTPEIPPPSFLP